MSEQGNLSADEKNTSSSNEIKHSDRKLIWTADFDFEVSNVDVSKDKISELVEKHEANISDLQFKRYPEKVVNKIVLQVSNIKFHVLVSALKDESIYMNRAEVNSIDVTDDYMSLISHLKTKKEVRDRHIEITKTKTGSIKDALKAEEFILVITEEIEDNESRLRCLNDTVNFSTITMQISQTIDKKDDAEPQKSKPSEKANDTSNFGWSEIKNIFLG